MQVEDKKYLLQKDQLTLRNDLNHFEQRKTLYENMYNMMEQFNVRTTQERMLLSDLGRLINFFDSKMDIVKIKLRNIETMLDLLP